MVILILREHVVSHPCFYAVQACVVLFDLPLFVLLLFVCVRVVYLLGIYVCVCPGSLSTRNICLCVCPGSLSTRNLCLHLGMLFE